MITYIKKYIHEVHVQANCLIRIGIQYHQEQLDEFLISQMINERYFQVAHFQPRD